MYDKNYYVGNQIGMAIPDISSWSECRQICVNHQDCNFWTWVGPLGYVYNGCLLISGEDPGTFDSEGAVSGPWACSSTAVRTTSTTTTTTTTTTVTNACPFKGK